MCGIQWLNRSLAWSRVFFLLVLLLSSSGISEPTRAVAGQADGTTSSATAVGPVQNPADLNEFRSVSVSGYLTCEVPVDWHRESSYHGLSQDEKKVYGFDLSRHAGDAVPLRISVHYYAEGNRLHSTPELYIASKSHPIAEQAGSYRYGEVFDAVVAGRPAKTFMRPYRQFVSAEPLLPDPSKDDKDDVRIYEHREMMARRVPLIERYIVIPVGAGFFALCYSAPDSRFEEFLGIFEHVTATFSPML